MKKKTKSKKSDKPVEKHDVNKHGETIWSKMKFEIGQKIENTDWTVIDDTIYHKNGHKLKVQCGCGVERLQSVATLVNGRPARCNKCSRKFMTANPDPSWRGTKGIPAYYISRTKEGARQRGLPFNITSEDAYDQYTAQSGTCALTFAPISFAGAGIATTNNASLDRIDSTKGYTTDNIQWVHKDINRMKNSFPQATFTAYCHAVANATPVPQPNIFTQLGMKPIEDK